MLVLRGPDRDAVLDLLGTVRVGTHPEAELRLSDPTASRYHLELDARDCGVSVRDLKSTNGTYPSGARVEQALLEKSSTLVIGQTSLRVSIAEIDLGAPSEASSFREAVGASAAMRQLFGLLTAVAKSDATVVLLGETGTGKEVLARSIHSESPRSAKPFIVVDCSSLPAGLAESELFGHLRGAFTGAVENRPGAAAVHHFERALQLSPSASLPPNTSPKITEVFERICRRLPSAVQASRPEPSPPAPQESLPAGMARPAQADGESSGATRRSLWGPAALGGAAVVATVVGIVFGVQARQQESKANNPNTPYLAAKSAGASAISNARAANWSYAVAAGSALAGTAWVVIRF